MEAPEVLTDEQMNRLGGEPVALAPSHVPAPSKETGKLPVEETLTPDQMEYRSHLAGIHEPPLIREDPAMTVATTMAGAGAGRAAGSLIGKLSPVAAKIIEPAVAGATTSALQGGTAKQNLTAGGVGAALGVPGAALSLIRGAPAAVAERLPLAVTGGLKTKAAKQVAAGTPVADVLDLHPELKRVLATSGDVGTKFNATSSTLNKLSSANDTVYDAIQAQHQGVPLEPLEAKIKAVADKAHAESDDVLEAAAHSAIENLKRYGDVADKRGLIATATQVRGIRNNLARKVQALNPTLGPTEAQAAADEIRKAINEGIEDIAGKTKGVDVTALKDRNRQIAQLMPMQRTLREQAINAKLMPAHDPLADLIEHPSKTIAGLARAVPAHADAYLADRPGLQSFAAGKPGQFLGALSDTAPLAAPIAARKPPAGELEFSARVAQGMKNGMSLKQAMDAAKE